MKRKIEPNPMRKTRTMQSDEGRQALSDAYHDPAPGIRREKTWRPATAKQRRVLEKLNEHPEWSDRQIAAEVGATHPTVATIRQKWEIYHRRREGADGITRRAKLPHRVEVRRFKADLEEAADELCYTLRGIANAFEYSGGRDGKFKAIVEFYGGLVARDVARVLNSIAGEANQTSLDKYFAQKLKKHG
jgi:hypothetical protein